MFQQKKSVLQIILLGLMVFGLTEGAYAHHSFAMYDISLSNTFTGKLLRFIPGANHAQILFEVINADGEVERQENGDAVVWGIELGGAAMISRRGVTVKSFPLGTILTVTLSPLRNGKPFGALQGNIVKCGATLPVAGCNADTGEVFEF